jgi:Tfp pilus assembly protein PilF
MMIRSLSLAFRVAPFSLLVALLAGGCGGNAGGSKGSDDPETVTQAVYQAIGAKKYDVAESTIQRALEHRPAEQRFLELLVGIRIVRGDWSGALAAADQTLSIHPKSTDARNNRGIALLELGRPVEAEAEFRAVLLDPKFPQIVRPRFNLALALARQDKTREALAELYQVQRLDPGMPGIWARIGEVRERLLDWNEAVANYLEAVRRDPTDHRSMLRLGVCFSHLATEAEKGNDHAAAERSRALAHRYLSRVVELSPGSPAATEARALLVGEETRQEPER